MLKRLTTIALVLLLGGCAGQATQSLVPQSVLPHSVTGLHNWLIEGKIGVLIEDQRHSATLRWQQQGAQFHLFMAGPFGQGATTIEGSDQLIRIQRPDQPLLVSDEPEQLLQQELGWSVPLNALPWWAKGLPAPDQPSHKVADEQGVLTRFEQLGWKVELLRYAEQRNLRLPEKIRLSQRTNGSTLAITLIFKQWHF